MHVRKIIRCVHRVIVTVARGDSAVLMCMFCAEIPDRIRDRLMSHMGAPPRGRCLIYQHAGQDRGKVIAKALGQAFKKAREAIGHERSRSSREQ